MKLFDTCSFFFPACLEVNLRMIIYQFPYVCMVQFLGFGHTPRQVIGQFCSVHAYLSAFFPFAL